MALLFIVTLFLAGKCPKKKPTDSNTNPNTDADAASPTGAKGEETVVDASNSGPEDVKSTPKASESKRETQTETDDRQKTDERLNADEEQKKAEKRKAEENEKHQKIVKTRDNAIKAAKGIMGELKINGELMTTANFFQTIEKAHNDANKSNFSEDIILGLFFQDPKPKDGVMRLKPGVTGAFQGYISYSKGRIVNFWGRLDLSGVISAIMEALRLREAGIAAWKDIDNYKSGNLQPAEDAFKKLAQEFPDYQVEGKKGSLKITKVAQPTKEARLKIPVEHLSKEFSKAKAAYEQAKKAYDEAKK